MSNNSYAYAIDRIQRHLADLADGKPLRILRLQELMDQTFGLLPLFPNQFLYVVNYTTQEVVHARGFQQVLGYPDHGVDLPLIYGTWHPEDAPYLAAITEHTGRELTRMQPPMRPFEVTLTLDYRVRKANGDYIKVQRQTTVFSVDEATNRTISTFSLCRDISNLKTSNRVGWQWEGRGAEKLAFPEFADGLQYRPTPREMEVLKRMVQGQASKAIAQALHISMHTVNTHRRNLLDRTGCRNSAELVRLSTEQGWT